MSEVFGPLNVADKHEFFLRLAARHMYEPFMDETRLADCSDGREQVTRFTRRKLAEIPDTACLREDRPALLVSSTSWTPDEDFGILLNALQAYDELQDDRLPPVVAVVTGKGPLKAFYLQEIGERRWRKTRFLTPWLPPHHYPRMLACADLGLSLHTSTSGLDLPMKVVDMFGCGLPVLAKRFACVGELVKEGENGHLFDTESDLCNLLVDLLTGFPPPSVEDTAPGKGLRALAQNLRDDPLVGWTDNWDATVWPLLQPPAK